MDHERRAMHEGWEKCNLLKYISLVTTGVKTFNGTRKYVETGNLDTGKILGHQLVTFDSKPSRANQEARINDLIFAKMKDTEKVFLISKEEENNIFSTGFTIMRISNPTKILPKFLYYWLRDSNFQKKKNQECIGATQKAISANSFTKFNILLPPLDLQIKIALILEKSEETKRLRAQADELTDRLLQSVFLEMFGDPVKNPKGWEISTLENGCSELYRYPTFYGFEYSKTGVPVVRINNICPDGMLDPNVSNYVFIEPKLNENFPRTIVELNDIVMAVRGDGSTVKRIGLVNTMNLVGANISPNLIRFKTKSEILSPLYLFNLMISDSGQRLLEKYVTRTAKKTITAKDIKKIPIPLPPLSLQQKFTQIVEKVESTRRIQLQSHQQINNLFNIFMQKAFKGELMV